MVFDTATFGAWIDVKERVPTAGHRYLVARAGSRLPDVAGFTGGQWGSCGHIISDVTHWMPLPEPPTPPKSAMKVKDDALKEVRLFLQSLEAISIGRTKVAELCIMPTDLIRRVDEALDR